MGSTPNNEGKRNLPYVVNDTTHTEIDKLRRGFEFLDEQYGQLRMERDELIGRFIEDTFGREAVVSFALGCDDLEYVPIQGQCKFIYHNLWTDRIYRSPVLENPTCLELAVIADEAIHTSQDYHHHFFEGWSLKGGTRQAIPVYELVFGS
jgi:hypothetical protein